MDLSSPDIVTSDAGTLRLKEPLLYPTAFAKLAGQDTVTFWRFSVLVATTTLDQSLLLLDSKACTLGFQAMLSVSQFQVFLEVLVVWVGQETEDDFICHLSDLFWMCLSDLFLNWFWPQLQFPPKKPGNNTSHIHHPIGLWSKEPTTCGCFVSFKNYLHLN